MSKIVKIGELNNLDVYKLTGYRYVHMRDYFYHLDNHYVDGYHVADYGKKVELIGKMSLELLEEMSETYEKEN